MDDPGRDLLKGVQKLDESSCVALIRLAEPVIGGALGTRSFRAEDDRDDVAQQIRYAVITTIHQFDPARGKFSSWVYGIARNCYNSYWRDWNNSREKPFAEMGEEFDPAAPDKSVTIDRQPSQLAKAFRAVYDSLPSEERAVVDHMLAHGDGFGGHGDLAQTLGISVAAAKQRVHRMKKRLKKEMERELQQGALPMNEEKTHPDRKQPELHNR